MKDIFKEATKKDYKGNHRGPEKVSLHRRIRHFLKQLLKKEVKEIDNANDSKR